ncbi:extracellular solute-binding protein [Paenibacillus eucommiae]|uniref:Aldouronate transport system substrate-binding protein n=1 Tax=Paenibacillus eucommiae TaxID=1355755 RepID=A0ABS4IM65_9BACL|nr:extracellular solute-binding protein [Paenibacillus eucommiae]MBP1988656.1 putative aldouronate transport system substrate-binding protein [Paenibacillus eucommiae]
MNKMKRIPLLCLMMAVMVLVSACGGSPASTSEGTKKPAATDASTATPEAGKQTVELTTIRSSHKEIKFDAGETMDKNAVYDAYEKELGVAVKNLWVADGAQYEQKLKMSIASNDIPDFMVVSSTQLQQLIEADMIMDISSVYDKTATDATKAFLTKDGGNQMNSAKFGGKLMAIPATDSPFNGSTYLWVRKDWLKQLNLPEPKTMQDVIKISEAFTEQDPGGTGKSFGLTLTKELWSPAYGLTGFFNGYKAYPGQWIKNSDGKLVYGSIQPEMKTALKQLQDMFNAGQIDPEFGVKDAAKENELIAGNKLGMAYGAFWLSSYPLAEAAVKDGKLVQDWEAYPIVSIDAQPAKTQVASAAGSYWVISKDCKNPEAVIQILNKWIQIMEAPSDADKVYSFGNSLEDKGQNYWMLNPVLVYSQDQNVQAGELLPKAIEAKDPSLLGDNADRLGRYDHVQKYVSGDASMWFDWAISKPGGTFAIMNQYLKEDRYHFDAFYGAQTPTMTEKNAVLQTKMDEIFMKIIMNQVSVDEFDKFVQEWQNLGGETITKEVNDWYAAVSKN